ncbi:MAG: hypothetical protein KKF44_08655 [Nanoarchaeota archaeon]|nr:hypothetical protein [Nanoarchaeota archaeon]
MDEDKYRRMRTDVRYKKKLKKETLYLMFGIFFVMLLLSLIFHWSVFIILTIIGLSAAINYSTNLLTFRVDTGQEFFFSILVTRAFGLHYGILLIIIAEFLPDLITARLDKDTMFSIIISVFLNMIANGLVTVPFVTIGLILTTVKFILMIILDLMFGFDLQEMVCETGFNFVINLILFAGFGQMFMALLI